MPSSFNLLNSRWSLEPVAIANLNSTPSDLVSRAMNPSDYRVRRATLDDIGILKRLCETMRFPAGDLERRLTEFQVIEGPDGKVMGALGSPIAERQAGIHSEA